MLSLNHTLFLEQLRFVIYQSHVLSGDCNGLLCNLLTWLINLFLQELNSYVKVVLKSDEITAFKIQIIQARLKKTFNCVFWATNNWLLMNIK